MSISLFVFIIVLFTLGTAFLSSIFGMLGGLILMGVLVSIMPVSTAMILHGLIQLTSNGYRAWLNRKDIIWSIVATLFLGNVIALLSLMYILSQEARSRRQLKRSGKERDQQEKRQQEKKQQEKRQQEKKQQEKRQLEKRQLETR